MNQGKRNENHRLHHEPKQRNHEPARSCIGVAKETKNHKLEKREFDSIYREKDASYQNHMQRRVSCETTE